MVSGHRHHGGRGSHSKEIKTTGVATVGVPAASAAAAVPSAVPAAPSASSAAATTKASGK